jgi:SAM-dependent methyltransferase
MTRTRPPRRSFDDLVPVFDRYAELVGAPLLRYIADRLPVWGSRAVDLGAGTGQHALLLSEHYEQVLGVDVSGPMIAHAARHRVRSNIRYEQRDLLDVTPDRDGRFDLVLSTHALHHVVRLDAALLGIRDLVAPGGQVILVDNVDSRRQVPRRWFVTQALSALGGDLRHRRRPIREAMEVYRLSTHPAWLDHLTTDVFLPPEEFESIYGSVFPEAEFTPMYRARAVHWQHPG